MRGIRWLPVGAAMAVVALSAPAAGAQDKQPTANGHRRRRGERRSARDAGRDRRPRPGRQRLRRGDRGRERARRRRAVQLRHRRRRLHDDPRRPHRQDHGAGLARDRAEGHAAELVLHQRRAADRRAVPGQPLQRPERRRARHPGAVGVRAAPLRHLLAEQGRRLRRQRRAQGLHRRPDLLRPDDAERARTSTTSRRRRRSTSTPTARRTTSARRSRTPTSRRPTSCSGATASTARSTAAPSARRSRRPPTTRRSRRPPTTPGGPG